MEHMSLARRRIYFYSFCLVFLIVAIVLGFYASGYRLTKDWKFSGTGGIYVYASESSVDISLNGEKKAQSGIFQRGVLLDGLNIGKYSVEVSKAGFSSWRKNIEVKSGYVSEGHPFLISKNLEIIPVPEFASSSVLGTKVKNQDYADALLLFQKKQIVGSTTPQYGDNFLKSGNLVILEKGKTVSAVWLGDAGSMPYFFCNAVICGADTSATSTVFANALLKSHIDFLPGRNDVILLSTTDGIEAVELDIKQPQNIAMVYKSKNADFRVLNGTIFIKEGDEIFEINL